MDEQGAPAKTHKHGKEAYREWKQGQVTLGGM